MGSAKCAHCGKPASGLFDFCSGECRAADTATYKIFIGSSGASYPDFVATSPDAEHALHAKAAMNRHTRLSLCRKLDNGGEVPTWEIVATIEG